MSGYVSSDDYELALAIAKYLFSHLQGQGRVLVVTGPGGVVHQPGASARLSRCGQPLPRASKWWARWRATMRARWRASARRSGCATSRRSTPAWWPTTSWPSGVLDALDAAGRSAAVVGVNAIPQAVEAIAAGRMLATADFNAMQMAYLATECAVRHLRGESVPTRIELPVQIVDRGNCAQWNLPYAQRPVLTLEQLRRQT